MVGSNRKRLFVIVSLDSAVHAAAAVSVQQNRVAEGAWTKAKAGIGGPARLHSIELTSNICVDEPISSGEASCRVVELGPQSMRTTWCWGKWLGLAPQWVKSCFVKKDWDAEEGGALNRVWFVGEILTLGFCQSEIWGTMLFCWRSIRGNYFGCSMCFGFWRWCWLPSGSEHGTCHNSEVVGLAPTQTTHIPT